jgi:hypothetical protein
MRIGRRRHSLLPSIFEDCTDCLLGIGERFLFGIALGHDLGQGRDKHGKATAFLRLKNDGIAVACAMTWLLLPMKLNGNNAIYRIKSIAPVKLTNAGDTP